MELKKHIYHSITINNRCTHVCKDMNGFFRVWFIDRFLGAKFRTRETAIQCAILVASNGDIICKVH